MKLDLRLANQDRYEDGAVRHDLYAERQGEGCVKVEELFELSPFFSSRRKTHCHFIIG